MRIYYNKKGIIWIAPGAVSYNREEVDFLLPYLREMREGAYPAEPTGGYVEGKRAGITSHAYYEAACQIAAELDTRLARTGLDRELVERAYCDDWSDKDLAHYYALEPGEVRRRIRSAVSYISSGKCQRWVECSGCVHFPKCRKKKKQHRQTYTYSEWISHRSREWDKPSSLKYGNCDIKT